MPSYVRTTGFKELEKTLLELGTKTAQKAGRAAVRQAAKPIQDAARANAPVKDGRLRRSIKTRVDRLRHAGFGGTQVLSALVYVSEGLGPRPRKTDRQSTVKGKLQEARYDYQIGSWANVYGRFVEFGIPGHAPHPFLRPAWDSQGGQVALKRIGETLSQAIERAFNDGVRKR